MDTFHKFFIGAVIVVLAAFCYGIYWDSQQPTFSLQKDGWACTKSHQVTYLHMVGKVMIPQHRTVCDTWERV